VTYIHFFLSKKKKQLFRSYNKDFGGQGGSRRQHPKQWNHKDKSRRAHRSKQQWHQTYSTLSELGIDNLEGSCPTAGFELFIDAGRVGR
jgi:hypothetical protein